MMIVRISAVIGLFVLSSCKRGGSADKPDDHHDHHDDHDEAASDAGAGPGAAAASHLEIDPEMIRDLRITTARAEIRSAGERVSVLGELGVNEDAYAEVAAPIPARVTRVLAKAGELVAIGRPLVELLSADLGRVRAERESVRVRSQLAEAALVRKRALAADKLVTARELDEAAAEAAAAAAELRALQGELNAAGAGGAGGAGRLLLRSPVAGTVIERSVVLGQLADPSRTLFRIGNLERLWLTAHVFERDAVRVATGGHATVSFPALPAQSFEASVTLIGREVELASRTVSVRLELDNPGGILKPGMSATVQLPLGDSTGTVVAVPIAALQRVNAAWVVFLPRGPGRFEVRPVGRGRELGSEVEILSGLGADDEVVVDGAFLLKAEADKARGGGDEHHH